MNQPIYICKYVYLNNLNSISIKFNVPLPLLYTARLSDKNSALHIFRLLKMHTNTSSMCILPLLWCISSGFSLDSISAVNSDKHHCIENRCKLFVAFPPVFIDGKHFRLVFQSTQPCGSVPMHVFLKGFNIFVALGQSFDTLHEFMVDGWRGRRELSEGAVDSAGDQGHTKETYLKVINPYSYNFRSLQKGTIGDIQEIKQRNNYSITDYIMSV